MNPQRTPLPALAMALAIASPAFALEGHAHAQPEKHALAGTRIIELTVDDAELMHMLLDEGVNPLACRPTPGTDAWLATDEQLELIARIGMPHRILIHDVPAHVEHERRTTMGLRGDDWYATYHTWEEINERLDQLVAANPGVVHALNVGTTYEGRTIQGVRIGTSDEGVKPAVLFNGCQHAREWVATMVPTFIADELAAGYGVDPRVTALIELVDVYIIPVVNPDGYIHTYEEGGNRFWRKNRRDNGTTCLGVDLNRNWDIDWNGGESTSTDTCSDVYVGTAPFSEPESSAMRDFILARPNIAAHIDFHNYSQVILQNWGWTSTPPPDQEAIDALGAKMSEAIQAVNGFSYPHGGGDELLYLASGVFPDWTYDATGAFGYTIELRPTGSPGFELPPEEIRPTAEENFQGILEMMEWAGVPISVGYPDGRPAQLRTDATTSFDVDLSNGTDSAVSGDLVYRLDGGIWLSSPLVELPSGLWRATLPTAPCDASPEYYLSLQTQSGLAVQDPLLAPDAVYTAGVISDVLIAFNDDGETDPGWTVTCDAADGCWDRGTPVGGGDRGDPPADGDASGQCWLTDNVDGNTDVDGGSTILTSPVLDASFDGATLNYLRWYSNDSGASPNEDTLVVDVSDDGGATWVNLEVIGPTGPGTGGGWFDVSFVVADIPGIQPSEQFRVRFNASDVGNGSVIEAGIDGISVVAISCVDESCQGDVDGNGTVGVEDLLAVIADWNCSSDCTADINGDLLVNVGDLLLVIGGWGNCNGG
tara:strand:- start:10178 stop:12472 length:2295 start_codon:yes stop_codon:yes gene_type:complete